MNKQKTKQKRNINWKENVKDFLAQRVSIGP